MFFMQKRNYSNEKLSIQEASAVISANDDKKRLLNRKKLIRYLRRNYGVSKERLEIFEASGRDFDKKPVTEQQAIIMAKMDFDGYDMDRVKLFGENGLSLLRKYFVCAQILSGYGEAQLQAVIKNLNNLDRYEKAKEKFLRTNEEVTVLIEEARRICGKNRNILNEHKR